MIFSPRLRSFNVVLDPAMQTSFRLSSFGPSQHFGLPFLEFSPLLWFRVRLSHFTLNSALTSPSPLLRPRLRFSPSLPSALPLCSSLCEFVPYSRLWLSLTTSASPSRFQLHHATTALPCEFALLSLFASLLSTAQFNPLWLSLQLNSALFSSLQLWSF